MIETTVKWFDDFSLPIPMPKWTLEKLSDAQGSFVTWSYAWIRFTAMSPKGSKREIGSSSSVAITPILTDVELKDLSQDCLWLHKGASRMREEDPIILPLQQEQFCFVEEPYAIFCPSDIGQFLRGQMLNVVLIHAYMSAAYEELNCFEPPLKFG